MINGIPTLDDLDLQGKRVLVRFDYNVKYLNGKVSDDERILRTLPTLTYILSKASSVIILSHLGRPEKVGEIDKNFSLKKVAEHLSALLSEEIYFHDDFSSFTIGRMINDHRPLINTDLECIQKNKISITPLSLNLTNNEFFNRMNYDI